MNNLTEKRANLLNKMVFIQNQIDALQEQLDAVLDEAVELEQERTGYKVGDRIEYIRGGDTYEMEDNDVQSACDYVKEWIEKNGTCGSGKALIKLMASIFNHWDYKFSFVECINLLDGQRLVAAQIIINSILFRDDSKPVYELAAWVVENGHAKGLKVSRGLYDDED